MKTMLWAHPRSRSTAFERAFIERGDCVVLHEPFSKVFYHGADEHSLITAVSSTSGFLDSPLLDDVRYVPAAPVHCVVKDMPAHAEYPDSYLASFTHHILLVRKPEASIRSFYKVDPHFAPSEAGYEEMLRVAQRLQRLGAAVMVVEADEFAAAPKETMTRVCHFLGVLFETKMVEWEARTEIPAWGMWTEFHKTALTSTTISADVNNMVEAAGRGKVDLPDAYVKLIRGLEPIYVDILKMGVKFPPRQPLQEGVAA